MPFVRTLRMAFLALPLFLLSGCEYFATVYKWHRTPEQVFTVRIHMDGKKLSMVEQFSDGSAAWPQTIRDYFTNCSVFNDDNWECGNSLGTEKVVMAKGSLTHLYWGEERKYLFGTLAFEPPSWLNMK